MSFPQLYKDVRGGKILPVYLLHGTEPFYIDQAVRFFETELIPEAERSFNQTIFYGKDSKAQDIIDTCRRFPMMAERQLVIIKEANQLRDIEGLDIYLSNIVPSTVLVIAYKTKKYDARKKVYKLISKQGLVIESKTPFESQMPAFLEEAMREKGLKAEGKATAIMLDHIGSNLSRLVNELDKLSINVPKGTSVTADHIEQFIGISKDFNVFELQNALLEKNLAKAFGILHYLMANPKENPLVLLMFNLHTTFRKLYILMHSGHVSTQQYWNQFQIHSSSAPSYQKALKLFSIEEVETIFGDLLEFDLRSKGVKAGSAKDAELMKELVVRICKGERLLL